MRRTLAFAITAMLAVAASAQTAEDQLRAIIEAYRYAPLAEHARIQGDVHLRIREGEVGLLSGHSLLARNAIETAKRFGPILGKTDLDVTFHFALTDTVESFQEPVTVPVGNAAGRVFLRLLGRKTTKEVLTYRCEEKSPPPSQYKLTGPVLEIWVFGRIRCLQTTTATLKAQAARLPSPQPPQLESETGRRHHRLSTPLPDNA